MEAQHSSAPPLKSTRKLRLLFVFAFSGWIAYFAMFAATVADRRDRNRRLDSLQKQIDSLAKQADSLGAERQRRAAKGADKR